MALLNMVQAGKVVHLASSSLIGLVKAGNGPKVHMVNKRYFVEDEDLIAWAVATGRLTDKRK